MGDLRDIVEYCDIYKQGSVYESALLLSEIINQKTIETGVPKDKTPTRNLAVARELLNEILTATIGKKSYYFYGPFFYKNQFPKGKEEETYLILKDTCEVIKYEYVDNPLLCRCAENFNRTDWFMKQDKKSKNASFGGVQKKF